MFRTCTRLFCSFHKYFTPSAVKELDKFFEGTRKLKDVTYTIDTLRNLFAQIVYRRRRYCKAPLTRTRFPTALSYIQTGACDSKSAV